METKGQLAYVEKSSHPRFSIGVISCKEGLQIRSLIPPNSTVLVGRHGAVLMGQ